MVYRILYHPDVVRDDIPPIPQNMHQRIRRAIEERLSADPIAAGKPLRQSLKGHRKIRVGDYRIIYRVDAETVILVKIGHRREVYPRALRRLGGAVE